jgi:UrcA family protein
MSKKSLLGVLLVAAVAFAGAVGATQPITSTEAPSVVVSYDDLRLDSAAGIRSLYARITSAAADVCSPLESRVLGLKQAHAECVATAVAEGVAAVDNVQLTSLHEKRVGRVTVVASN